MTDSELNKIAELLEERLLPKVRREIRAAQGLLTSEQMANHLGLSLSRFRDLYNQNRRLWAVRVELATRGEGTELRWDLAEVEDVLRPTRRRSA